MEYILTDEQESAVKLVEAWLEGMVTRCLIEGFPGTGKTFTASLALVGSDLSQIACCAPSHKAKNVIREYLDSNGLQEIDVYTVHGFLGLTPEITDEGKQKFEGRSGKSKPYENYRFLWADECSMYGTDIFTQLIGLPLSILFTGDRRQLLPVGDETFPVFDYFENREDKVALTEPQRFSGPIKELVYGCIPYIDAQQKFSPDLYLLSNNCRYLPNWFEHWKTTNSDKVVLAFTNRSVNTVNALCRNHILGGEVTPFYTDEELIAYAPVNDIDDESLCPNGSVVYVDSFEPYQQLIASTVINCYRVMLRGFLKPVLVIRDKGEEKRLNVFLDGLAKECKEKKARWSYYYYVKGIFADLRPTYALTIHKSQGSGYDDVYLLNDFGYLKGKEVGVQPRLWYVGASRAKKNLYVSTVKG